MLKCVILLISSILKKVAVTLTQLHAREEKKHGFLSFLLKIVHYFIGLNTSLSYISMVMAEKLCLNVPFFADFLDFENGCCYLNTIARKRRKNTWVSCTFAEDRTLLYWFKYIIVLH